MPGENPANIRNNSVSRTAIKDCCVTGLSHSAAPDRTLTVAEIDETRRNR
jgi:hypothetical protein